MRPVYGLIFCVIFCGVGCSTEGPPDDGGTADLTGSIPQPGNYQDPFVRLSDSPSEFVEIIEDCRTGKVRTIVHFVKKGKGKSKANPGSKKANPSRPASGKSRRTRTPRPQSP